MSSGQDKDRAVLRENPDGSIDFIDEAGLDADATGGAPPPPAPPGDGSGDGAAAGSQTTAPPDDDDDDDDDAPPARTTPEGAPREETLEEKRERRKQERTAKRERARQREENLRQQLLARDRVIDDLRSRVDVVQRRTTGADIANLDARIRRGEEQVTYLKSVIADGTATQNGQAVAEATAQMLQQMREIQEVSRVRTQLVKAADAPQQPQLDPRMVVNAATWMSANKWYNPASNDADSREVLVIDQRLAEEGFNPSYPDYWDELSRRVAARLPHRAGRQTPTPPPPPSQTETNAQPGSYNAGASQRKPSRSVVTGAGGSGSAVSGRAEVFRLSPERVQALKDAGMWDDPVARNNAIRRYKEFDAKSQ